MDIFDTIGIPKDREVLREVIDEYRKQVDFKDKLRKFLCEKGIFREFPEINDKVIEEIAWFRVIWAIIFWEEMSSLVFQNREKFLAMSNQIMWWIPQIDEDCEWLYWHEESMRQILGFYFWNR